MNVEWGRTSLKLRTNEMKRIASATAVGLLLGLLFAVVSPSWYESTLTVVPAGQSKPGVLGAQIAGALGGALDLPGDLSGNADIERIAAVLQSRSVTDAVIQKFDLSKRYHDKYIEQTRKNVWTHCWIRIERKARLVALTCEDKEPTFVASVLEYFGDYGNQVFRRVSTTSATEEVRFLEQRVTEMRREADESARRLREFEERNKIIDLESQSKAVVSAMASLRSQEISKELQLSYLNSFSSREESTAIQLRQQLAVMSAKFRKLEEPLSAYDPTADAIRVRSDITLSAQKGGDIFPPALSVPKLRFELEQLYRDRKIREADLLLLMQRLEMAKVSEARDTSAFQILDYPDVPTYRSRPKRLLALVVGLLLGILVGTASVLGPIFLRPVQNAQKT